LKAQDARTVTGSKRGLSWAFYLGSLFCFALGLMSKPMVVTLPFVLLLLDYWPLQRFASLKLPPETRILSRLILEKMPFFLLSLGSCITTLLVQRSAGATLVVRNLTWTERLANAVSSYVLYLGKMIWPAKLAIIYPHPAKHYYLSDQWPAWEILLSGFFLLLVSVLFIRLAWRRPYLAVGWFWFVGMLLPVIGFVQVCEQAMADRYTYLPLIGPVISLVWWAFDEVPSRMGRANVHLGVAASVIVVAVLFGLTRYQLDYWQNTAALFEHAVAVTADNPSAQFGVGMGLAEQEQMSKAMVRFRVALAIDPSLRQSPLHHGPGASNARALARRCRRVRGCLTGKSVGRSRPSQPRRGFVPARARERGHPSPR
jgi:hypothetical protein